MSPGLGLRRSSTHTHTNATTLWRVTVVNDCQPGALLPVRHGQQCIHHTASVLPSHTIDPRQTASPCRHALGSLQACGHDDNARAQVALAH
jgi:hypothetical protein